MNWPYQNIDYSDLDVAIKACEQIIASLGVVPYPSWQEKAVTERLIPEYAALMAWKGRYAIYNEHGAAFMLDMQNRDTYHLGEYYENPELALIDKQEKFAVVIGAGCLGVFDMSNKQLKLIDIDIDIPEGIVSLNQEGRKIEAICENGTRYVFEI